MKGGIGPLRKSIMDKDSLVMEETEMRGCLPIREIQYPLRTLPVRHNINGFSPGEKFILWSIFMRLYVSVWCRQFQTFIL